MLASKYSPTTLMKLGSIHTFFCHNVLKCTHCVHNTMLHFFCTFYFVRGQKVMGNSNQSISWPPLEPVHGTPRNKTREFQSSGSEFFPNWREAKHHMQVTVNTREEVIVQVLRGYSFFITGIKSCVISSISSLANRLDTSPEASTFFMYSRNDPSLISLSVNMKVIPFPFCPAVRYNSFRSSRRLFVLQVL